jgi:hypothetical protein
MSRSTSKNAFGWTGSGQTVTVIEAPVARNFRRKARVAFFVTLGIVGLLAGTVAAHYWHPILGGLFGLALGMICGAVIGLLILVWPVLRVFWHWLPEILLGLGTVYGWTWLMWHTPLSLSLVVVVLVVGLPAAIGPVRRRVMALWWCLVVRHRLRLCFAAFIATNRHGTLPLILPARPTPAGERVWVWLRPGLSLRDLETDGQMQKLAVACWANEARAMRASRRYAALIRIDITRREPLARDVPSPLPDHVPDGFADTANAPTSPGMPPTGLDLPDVPDDPFTVGIRDPRDTRDGRRKPRTGHTTRTPETDNSDYA